MQGAKRNIGLDILRATAIVMVVLRHGVTIEHIPLLGEFGTGVDLFFVLSGFLIGRIYFRAKQRGDFHLGGFWLSRWWRTIPPYMAALLVSVLASRWMPDEALRWYYAVFAQNYAGIKGFGPSWSLCVEEHFYLLLPLGGFLAERILGRRSFLWLLPVAFFTPLLLRLGTLTWTGTLPERWYWMTHFHCEGLIAGVWLAYLFVERPELFAAARRPARWLLPLTPILMLVLPEWRTRGLWANSFEFTLYAAGYAAWIRVLYDMAWTSMTPMSRFWRRAVTVMSLSSYSIYLLHTQVDHAMREWLGGMSRGPLKTGILLLTTLLISWIFYFLVERTSIVSRDRFLKSRRIGALPEAAETLPGAASTS